LPIIMSIWLLLITILPSLLGGVEHDGWPCRGR
jgi:hypothetical protein